MKRVPYGVQLAEDPYKNEDFQFLGDEIKRLGTAIGNRQLNGIVGNRELLRREGRRQGDFLLFL